MKYLLCWRHWASFKMTKRSIGIVMHQINQSLHILASHSIVMFWISAAPFLIQFLSNASWKMVYDGSSAWLIWKIPMDFLAPSFSWPFQILGCEWADRKLVSLFLHVYPYFSLCNSAFKQTCKTILIKADARNSERTWEVNLVNAHCNANNLDIDEPSLIPKDTGFNTNV